jgi:hypothetical protein
LQLTFSDMIAFVLDSHSMYLVGGVYSGRVIDDVHDDFLFRSVRIVAGFTVTSMGVYIRDVMLLFGI